MSYYLPQCRVLHANNREAIDPWFPLYFILPDRPVSDRISPCSSSSSSSSWHVLSAWASGVPSHTRSLPVSLHLDGPCQLCSAGDTLSRPSAATHDDPRPTHARTPSTAHTLLALPLPTAYFQPGMQSRQLRATGTIFLRTLTAKFEILPENSVPVIRWSNYRRLQLSLFFFYFVNTGFVDFFHHQFWDLKLESCTWSLRRGFSQWINLLSLAFIWRI